MGPIYCWFSRKKERREKGREEERDKEEEKGNQKRIQTLTNVPRMRAKFPLREKHVLQLSTHTREEECGCQETAVVRRKPAWGCSWRCRGPTFLVEEWHSTQEQAEVWNWGPSSCKTNSFSYKDTTRTLLIRHLTIWISL